MRSPHGIPGTRGQNEGTSGSCAGTHVCLLCSGGRTLFAELAMSSAVCLRDLWAEKQFFVGRAAGVDTRLEPFAINPCERQANGAVLIQAHDVAQPEANDAYVLKIQ